ncbi:MAG: hypothetical protein AAF236_02170 [Verrucomicrobiota bacterium]
MSELFAERDSPSCGDGKTCRFLDSPRCPECGSTLNTDGKFVWCSFVGDRRRGIKACDYGIRSRVTAEEINEPSDDASGVDNRRLVAFQPGFAAVGRLADRHQWAAAILATLTMPIWILPFAGVALLWMIVAAVKLAIFGDDDDHFSY